MSADDMAELAWIYDLYRLGHGTAPQGNSTAHAIDTRGVITIRTGSEKDQVFVEVADTGRGIAANDIARIFDPFFTTKPVGKGSGLGLSLSYGIVQKHRGRIEVSSEVGKGTVFRVRLPLERRT